MAITTRTELIETLTLLGVVGAAREGLLDAMFGGGPITPATTTVVGGVKQAASIANQGALTVTDIATAQTAITALVAKVNAILAGQKTAGQMV